MTLKKDLCILMLPKNANQWKCWRIEELSTYDSIVTSYCRKSAFESTLFDRPLLKETKFYEFRKAKTSIVLTGFANWKFIMLFRRNKSLKVFPWESLKKKLSFTLNQWSSWKITQRQSGTPQHILTCQLIPKDPKKPWSEMRLTLLELLYQLSIKSFFFEKVKSRQVPVTGFHIRNFDKSFISLQVMPVLVPNIQEVFI